MSRRVVLVVIGAVLFVGAVAWGATSVGNASTPADDCGSVFGGVSTDAIEADTDETVREIEARTSDVLIEPSNIQAACQQAIDGRRPWVVMFIALAGVAGLLAISVSSTPRSGPPLQPPGAPTA